MDDNTPFLSIDQPCDQAVDWFARQVTGAGMHIVQTFNLQAARSAQSFCTCPNHGTDHCDCQMVVLLVYGSDRQPTSVVAHGNHGQTWFSIVDHAEQRPDPQLETALRQALAGQISAAQHPPGLSRAA